MSLSVETKQEKTNLLPTPQLPESARKIDLTDNARQVFMRRYVRRQADGQPAESVDETFWRVAYHVAKVEENWGNQDIIERAQQFYDLLTTR
ncbi:MAG TPA: ribonucleoside-diphosphate reductase, adenosylcobalamin-dependent, partial [Chloroflexi bacterium]|nr:ribonucleoside-diphosphate reductase, adenosylcobalamin-dependent [Chloroflexota bacterium]